MLEVNDLNVMVNLKYIIKNLTFTLNKGDKLAIIGEEGNGKSTLLKVIFSKCDYANVTGKINKKGNKIGYLEQSMNDIDLQKSVFDYLFLDMNDYYNKINQLYKILKELKLNDELLNTTRLQNLSGGEKVKINILKLLLDDNDILLLDEPTNDLDIETLEWLEHFINETEIPIIYVSHDETLLGKTANAILHLEMLKNKSEPKYTFSKIGYDEYIKNRQRTIDKDTQVAKKEREEYKKQILKMKQIMNKVEYAQNKITRADPHGAKMLKRKMHSIKSQEKRMNNKDLHEIPDVEESINFFFEDVFVPPNKKILELKNEKLYIDKKVISKNINININGNEHVVIIGKNGVGKTTLLKKIYGILKIRTDIKVGYMPQNYKEVLNYDKTPIEFLKDNESNETLVRNYMGNMKFTSEEMVGKIKILSGGSKAKLLILKMILDKNNVLILDEPTRNVSPLSNPVIREALIDFKGTIISVSHDRKYINEVCDNVYELTNNGLIKIN